MKNRFLEVATLSFTGDVEKDFGSKAGVVIVEDPGQYFVRLRNALISCVCAQANKTLVCRQDLLHLDLPSLDGISKIFDSHLIIGEQ
jgi:hypothetical protein